MSLSALVGHGSGLAFIPSPAHNGFYLGPLFIHAYGLAYVFAVAAAIFIGRHRWRKAGGDPDLCYEVAMWGFPAGLIGGRIYFLITTPSQIPPHWWGPFAIWEGGLGIWGGMFGGILGGLYILRKRLPRSEIARFVDAAVPGLPVAQAIGRIGNYFNQELFGKPSTLPWALKISPAHRPPGFEHYATFQPTFLYEICWDFGLAAFLVWLGHHRRIRPPGLLALYVAGYSGFRIFEETLRIDYSNYVLGMRLNFWIATLLCLAGLAWFAAIQRGWPLWPRRSGRERPVVGTARDSGEAVLVGPGRATGGSGRREAAAGGGSGPREAAGGGSGRREGAAGGGSGRGTPARSPGASNGGASGGGSTGPWATGGARGKPPGRGKSGARGKGSRRR